MPSVNLGRLSLSYLPGFIFAGGLIPLLIQPALTPGPIRQFFIFGGLFFCPTLLWTMALRRQRPLLESMAGGAGLALLVPTVAALLLSYLPGPIPAAGLLLVAVVALLIPFSAALSPRAAVYGAQQAAWPRRYLAALLLILLLGAWLRLQNVTYKEFQGDEGVIMVRAAQALLGDEMALLRHQKGPVEVLLPLLSWGLGGAIDELWARGAVIWAGLMLIVAFAALCRRWLRAETALFATLLFTIGGLAVAFSRILQYQSLVMLWGTLSLLFADRYRERARSVDLLLAAAFLAGGLLAHYDGILVAPAVAWLVIGRWRQSPAVAVRHAVAGALIGTALLGLFYVPYLANPTIAGTGSYLLQDRLGGTLFSWSLPDVWRMATFYNSTYYVAFLLLLAAAGLACAIRGRQITAALLSLLAPLLFYTAIVADPRTHIYTIFPGLALVAAYGGQCLYERIRKRPARGLALFVAGLLVAVSTLFVMLLFVDVTPERQRTWHENRPPLYVTTWSEPPLYGLFGFPHQAGWRVASQLVADYPYGSNEEEEVTAWYMAQTPRTHCRDFETFLIAANAQDALPYDAQYVAQTPLQTVVTVNGAPSLHVHSRSPVGAPSYVEAAGRALWRTPQEVVPAQQTGESLVGLTLENQVRLLGYSIQGAVQPGSTLNVVLYWQALAPIEANYQVFVHLYDGEMWAQHDGAPDCNIRPTSGWEPGQIVRDAHQITLSPQTPTGEIPLLAGMYDLLSGARQTVLGLDADHVHLTNLRVGEDRAK